MRFSARATEGWGGQGQRSVRITCGTKSTYTDTYGNYTVSGLGNGLYSVRASYGTFTFYPAQATVTVNGANVTGVNFQMGRSVSGRVTLNGAGLLGVTMTLSGAASRSVATDTSGNYAFTGLANGTYTVTPSKTGYTFTPSSQSVTVSWADQTDINFTAAQTAAPQGMAGTGGSGSAGEEGLPAAEEGATLPGAMGKQEAQFQGKQESGKDAGTASWPLGPGGSAPAEAGAEGQEAQAFEGSLAEATPTADSPTTGALQNVATFFFAWDHLGTVRLVSNQDRTMLDRHDYEPFGVELTPFTDQADLSHRFTGHERDLQTGYDYMHYRFYGSNMGRFLKPDNIPGTLTDPQSWNLYAYVRNNPILLNDPSGHLVGIAYRSYTWACGGIAGSMGIHQEANALGGGIGLGQHPWDANPIGVIDWAVIDNIIRMQGNSRVPHLELPLPQPYVVSIRKRQPVCLE